MSIRFYFKGIETFDKKLQEKITRDSKRCWWHDEPDKNFTGYIGEDGNCYDVCSHNIWKIYETDKNRIKKYEEKFLEVKNTILESINIIEDFIESIVQISQIKGTIRSIKKKLENGYVHQDLNIRGGKKSRRYKKDNRRFLTDRELIDLREELGNLDNIESTLSKKIKFEETLEKVLKKMYHINESLMHSYNNRFEWYETVGLYKDYSAIIENLRLRINHFTFNNMKEKYELQKKELDITLTDIVIFEETLEKVSRTVDEDKKIEDMMTVKSERKVTKKAKFYIDENGNRIELDQSIDQVVIHK